MLKYGVIQGRLLPQEGDFIQNFPRNWREEFRIAQRVGASHIEWISGAPNEIELFQKKSPLFEVNTDELEVPISAVCLDWMVSTNHTTSHDRFIDGLRMLLELDQVQMLGIGRVVIPLLESASMAVVRDLDQGLFNDIISNFNFMLDEYPDVTFSLETDLDVDGMYEFICDLTKHHNFNITFDIGNLTRLGHDIHKHLAAYGDFIDSVHIKDCRVGGGTVPLGTGDTDLRILRDLASRPNVQYMTFQTARNPGLSEEDVFRYNVNIIEEILNG